MVSCQEEHNGYGEYENENPTDESNYEEVLRIKLLRNRRQQNRPINGPVEWYLTEAKTKTQ